MSNTDPQAGSQHSLDKSPDQEQNAASAQAAPTSVEPVTPQNSQVAGAATGEQNALLQGNVSGSKQEGAAEKASNLAKEMPGGTAGYHSQGSHAGAAEGQK